MDVSANVRYPGETDDVAKTLVASKEFTQRGGFAIRTMWSAGDTVIKSVKVTDLRAKAVAENTTKGFTFELCASLSDRQKEMLYAGGLLNYTKNNA